MRSVQVLSAIVALSATAVSAAATCTKDIKISEPTPTFDCKVIDASVTVDSDVAGDLVINGPEEITGDFILNNASGIISLSSTSIKKIGGTFDVQSLEFLSKLDMSALTDLNKINLAHLQLLDTLNFGTDDLEIEELTVSDTFIRDLSGLGVASVKNFRIDNNKKMTSFDSSLVNITGTLIISNNGRNMEINMDKLESAAEVQISNVKSFSAAALEEVTLNLKFDDNEELKSFFAPNLTKVSESLSFVNNKKLANISMPVLESVGGAFKIENNTAIDAIDGFPELQKVYGGISLRGSFEKVKLPKLDEVRGSVLVTSTTDISDFCEFFTDLKDSGAVEGTSKCSWNNSKANDDTDDDDGSSSQSDGSSSDDEDAAGMVSVNMAVLGLAGVVAAAQLW